MSHLHQRTEALRPEQIAILQRVFDRTCARAGIAKNTLRAEGLAATLFRLFQEGVQDENKLDELMAKIDFI